MTACGGRWCGGAQRHVRHTHSPAGRSRRAALEPGALADAKRASGVGTHRQRPKSQGGTLRLLRNALLRAPPILRYCFQYCVDQTSPHQPAAQGLESVTKRASNGGTHMPHMKLTLSVFIALFLFGSAASAQQATGAVTNSGAGTTQGVTGRGTGIFISSGRSSTIRIIGTPTNQPNRGRSVECSPVEQGIVGLIIGPTDLCDR